ncbi:MAG: protein kinase [Planctomycetes bacterium]|nr:protein kinase [Planctomycetota bacterium]
MSNPVDVALVRLAVSRGLLSPGDGQHMESLHQQGQGSALQLLEARGLATHDLQRSFGGTPFGCAACGFSCAANLLSQLSADLRCPHCGKASLAPGRSASGRMPAGSSYVRPTGAYPPAQSQHGAGSGSYAQRPSGTGSFSARSGTGRYGAASSTGGYVQAPNQGGPPSGQFAASPPNDSRLENTGGSHMPRAQTVIRPGSSIGGYVLGRELGRGACGHVFLGRRPGLSREFAIKVLRQEMLGSSEAVARFYREADVASKLNDRGVVSAFDVGQDGQHCYYAMDYCPGQTLKDRMRERPYGIEEAVELVQELARIQGVAHGRGVVHRDFKPSNIILAEPDGHPRVTDFGLARDNSVTGQSLSRTGDLIGTPIYMAPEQLLGERADVRADVYALGVILYELLCGKRPFEAPTTVELATMVLDGRPTPPRTLNPAIDPELEAIVLRALAKERDDRYRSGADFEAALRDYRSRGEAKRAESSPGRPARKASPRRGSSRSKLPLIVGVAAAIAVAGVGGGLLFASHQAEQERLAQEGRLDQALAKAAQLASAGAWEDVARSLLEAQPLADALQHPERFDEALGEHGAAYLAALDAGSAEDLRAAESRLRVLEGWPGFARAPALAKEVAEVRELLEARQELASLSRKAAQGAPYEDLQADLRSLEAEVVPRLKPYVQLARVEFAVRRGKLYEGEQLAGGLLGALRLPPEIDRAARLAQVVSVLWQERHPDAQRLAQALSTRWPDTREGKLADCLYRFSLVDLGAAQDRVRLVVEQHPDWLPAKVFGAVLVYYTDDGGLARDWLSTVNEQQPDNLFLHYASALSGAREQTLEGANEATSHLQTALNEGAPPLLDVMTSVAWVLRFSRQEAESQALLEQAERIYPSSGELRFTRAVFKMFNAFGALRQMQIQKGSEIAEEAAEELRRCKAENPQAFARSVLRMPAEWRDGVQIVMDSPKGEVLSTVRKMLMSGGLGGGRRRR